MFGISSFFFGNVDNLTLASYIRYLPCEYLLELKGIPNMIVIDFLSFARTVRTSVSKIYLVYFIFCRDSTQNLYVVLGALYSSCLFLGVSNASSVQPIVSIERTVFYREKAAGMYSSFPYAAAQVSS